MNVLPVVFVLVTSAALAQESTNTPMAALTSILERIPNHSVNYSTNWDGVVSCTVKCTTLEERDRVQQAILSVVGSCSGTLDPPTITAIVPLRWPRNAPSPPAPTVEERAKLEKYLSRHSQPVPILAALLTHADEAAGRELTIEVEFDSLETSESGSKLPFQTTRQPVNRFWVFQDGTRSACDFHPDKYNYVPNDQTLTGDMRNIVPTLIHGLKLKLTGKIISASDGDRRGHFLVSRIERL